MATVTTPPASPADVSALPKPLTNLQLELLRIFSRQLPEEDLLEIRQLIAHYFAQKLIQRANEVWDEQGWTDADVERMLTTKMRARKSTDAPVE